MNKYIKCVLSLTLICAVIATLLAAANYITAPVIAANEAAAANEALLVVMPNGEEFTAVDLVAYTLPKSVDEVYTEKNGGTVVKLTTTGFNPNMTIMVGVNADGTVSGATCLSSEETLGYEKTYGESVMGATVDTIDAVDTVAGATKTTGAYRAAVKDALNTAIIVGGGSVDIRSEEEIFADNLAAALPGGEDFTPMFLLTELDGINAVYESANKVGNVYVIGDKFVGVDADGNIIGDVDDETKAAVLMAAEKLANINVELWDTSVYPDMPSSIGMVYSTGEGIIVFEVEANGYGINGDKYIKSGEPISIVVSVTRDGKIISCKTQYQNESKGFGDVCGTPAYYSQFNGKTADTYKEVDAIAGATITSNGYMNAISNVFKALEIINGGADNE